MISGCTFFKVIVGLLTNPIEHRNMPQKAGGRDAWTIAGSAGEVLMSDTPELDAFAEHLMREVRDHAIEDCVKCLGRSREGSRV